PQLRDRSVERVKGQTCRGPIGELQGRFFDALEGSFGNQANSVHERVASHGRIIGVSARPLITAHEDSIVKRPFTAIVALLALSGCGPWAGPRSPLDADAESSVRLALALGERDPDAIDSYHGPPSWLAEAHAKRASLDDVEREAEALAARIDSRAG